MVDRDYSMMITHQPEWTKQVYTWSEMQCKKKYKIKCQVENIETGEVKVFASFHDSEKFYGWANARASQESRRGRLIQGKYKVIGFRNET